MAFTTWNPLDLSGVTLSLGNLRATVGGGNGGVRGAHSLNSGKYYWEYTYTTLNSNTIACGISLSSGSLTAPAAGTCILTRLAGNIFVNGSSSGGALGQIAASSVIGIAVDFSGQLIWFRVAPAGSWNGSGTANPATGVDGISISVIAGSRFPTMTGQGGDAITANFGASAFTGVVPSGFTSGFTDVVATAKRYIVEANDGTQTTTTSPQASGSLVHFVDAGPTLGQIRKYSGYVTTPVTYYVDDGPTLGEERTAT